MSYVGDVEYCDYCHREREIGHCVHMPEEVEKIVNERKHLRGGGGVDGSLTDSNFTFSGRAGGGKGATGKDGNLE